MVGVYDSGVGGLSVLRRLWVRLPEVPVVYVADTARAPYGGRSPRELARFGAEIARFLRRQGAMLLVVACNTTSSVALPAVQEAFGGPVVGMLQPAARAVARAARRLRQRPGTLAPPGRGLRVGVLATATTVASGAYAAAIGRWLPQAQVVQLACPDWVPLIEAGRLGGPTVEAVVARDLAPWRHGPPTVVVLGCTHYPFWEAAVRRTLGDEALLVDPADAVAREVAGQLAAPGAAGLPGHPGYDMFFTSGDPLRFEALARQLVGSVHARCGRLWAGVGRVRWEAQAVAPVDGSLEVSKPSAPSAAPAGAGRGVDAVGGRIPWPPPDWRGIRVAVVGLGAENLPLVRYLAARGATITACDRQPPERLGPVVDQLRGLGARLCLGAEYLRALSDADVAFLTPGMPKHLPEVQAAREAGVLVVGQVDLFLRLCRARVVAVTGSSGKTTTTTLLGRMLQAAGRQVWVGGNIGQVLIERVEEIDPEAWVVLELSSFQLETTSVSPHGAVVTNISPNHLDVHPDMAAYVRAKERVLSFQKPGDFAVLNADDPVVREMARRTPGQVLWFSAAGQRPAAGGAWVEGERLLGAVPAPGATNGAVPEPVELCRRADIPLRGQHNVANVLAAGLAALACGAPPSAIREAVRGFTGVPHRLEEVARRDGVLFVNDSIATSPARTVAALRAFQEPIVLIAGGYDKHLPFDEMAELAVARCRHVVLVGQTAGAIHAALQRAAEQAGGAGPTISRSASFEEAVRQAWEAARPGDVVLLSPGCASYDMFRNFEERGARFRELVRALAGEARPVATV